MLGTDLIPALAGRDVTALGRADLDITDAGAVERVWGEVVQADGDTLVVRMLSRPIAQTGAVPSALRVQANEIDDWALHLPDEVHGGFSVQAEMRLAQRAGRPVPSHIEQMKGRFRDPLLG